MHNSVLMKLEIINGCLQFEDNGHKTLSVDLKEISLEEANKQLFFYLRHITKGLHTIYNKRGISYD